MRKSIVSTLRSTRALTAAAGLATLAMVAAGCDPGPSAPAPDLSEVTIPADFTFATSRTAALTVSASEGVMAGQQDAALVVSRPDGVALFKGSVRRGAATRVEVPVPLEFDSVELRLVNQGVEKTQLVKLERGTTAGRFE
jgi:hypothetical protein